MLTAGIFAVLLGGELLTDHEWVALRHGALHKFPVQYLMSAIDTT